MAFGCPCVKFVHVPIQDTVYEYYVDVKTKNWMLWEEKLKGTWRYPSKQVSSHFPSCIYSFTQIFIDPHIPTYTSMCIHTCSAPFYKILVPTVDTLRYDFLVHHLIMVERPVLLVGPVGTGKTSVAQGVLQKLDPAVFNLLTINLSAQVYRVFM